MKLNYKNFLVIIVLAELLLICLFYINHVPVNLTKEDIAVFKSLEFFRPSAPLTFQQEIDLIKHVQLKVISLAPVGEGIEVGKSREPADLMRVRHGLCYDRSRTFDKVFNYLGFESRHVYILYKQHSPFYRAIFHHGQPSHAVTEVKTKKGWILVDSNTAWISLNKQGNPIDADGVWKRFAEFDNAPIYMSRPYWAIRGLYSRKGQFYGGFLPLPEINFPDFGFWALSLD